MKNTKERIIKEAAKLFMKQGFDGTSVAEIGTAVGISPSSLFSHFKNKEEIYENTIEKYVLNSLVTQKKVEDYENFSLRGLLDCYLQRVRNLMGYVEDTAQGGSKSQVQYAYFLLESSIKNEDSNKKLISLNSQELDMWEEVIKYAQENEEVRSDLDASVLAEIFRYSFVGMTHCLAIDNGATIKQVENMLNTFYKIIKK